MTFNLFLTVIVPYLVLFFILFVGVPVTIFGVARFVYEAVVQHQPKAKKEERPTYQPIYHHGKHA